MATHNSVEDFAKNVSEIPQFENLFKNETDRGCALLAASILDYELTLLLQNAFIPNNKVQKKVFSPMGPLGTLSAKIDFSYLLGYLSKKDYNKTHTIREIRNMFGHSFESLNFDTTEIADKIKSIGLSQFSESVKTNRELFIDIVNSLLIAIYLSAVHTFKPDELEHYEYNPQEFIFKQAEELKYRNKKT